MADFTIKRNDTKPYLGAALLTNGNAYVLTGASVKFIMKLPGAAVPKVSAAATILDAATGLIEYRWVAADTDTEGVYDCEWQVTDSELKVITFPNAGYFTVEVTEDLG